MSRLTNHHFIQTHHQLRRLWLHANYVYGHLTATEQWRLHDFFQPSMDLTAAELLAHRRRITAEQPNLPAQAGRALASCMGVPLITP